MGKLMGRDLVIDCGCLSVGTLDSPTINGALKSANLYTLPYTLFSREQVNKLFPPFT